MLLQLFDKYALPAIAFVLGNEAGAEASACLKQALPATDLNMVQQLCELLTLQLRESGGERKAEAGSHDIYGPHRAVECHIRSLIYKLSSVERLSHRWSEPIAVCAVVTPLHPQRCSQFSIAQALFTAFAYSQVLEAYFLQCCIWSIGAALVQTPEVPHRDKLDAFLKQCANLNLASGDIVPLGSLPEQSIYAFFIDEDASAWKVSACIGYHIADVAEKRCPYRCKASIRARN